MRHIFVIVATLLLGCASGNDINSKITTDVLRDVSLSEQQELLFGHYENVNNAYGDNYRGCCVLNSNRVILINYLIEKYEKDLGRSFEGQNMLLGTTNSKVWVIISPEVEEENPSYFIEFDKNSAKNSGFSRMKD